MCPQTLPLQCQQGILHNAIVASNDQQNRLGMTQTTPRTRRFHLGVNPTLHLRLSNHSSLNAPPHSPPRSLERNHTPRNIQTPLLHTVTSDHTNSLKGIWIWRSCHQPQYPQHLPRVNKSAGQSTMQAYGLRAVLWRHRSCSRANPEFTTAQHTPVSLSHGTGLTHVLLPTNHGHLVLNIMPLLILQNVRGTRHRVPCLA